MKTDFPNHLSTQIKIFTHDTFLPTSLYSPPDPQSPHPNSNITFNPPFSLSFPQPPITPKSKTALNTTTLQPPVPLYLHTSIPPHSRPFPLVSHITGSSFHHEFHLDFIFTFHPKPYPNLPPKTTQNIPKTYPKTPDIISLAFPSLTPSQHHLLPFIPVFPSSAPPLPKLEVQQGIQCNCVYWYKA